MGTLLYHGKRLLNFETHVAPASFDRKAQPADIYDIFEKYYHYHKNAKWIYSVDDTATASYFQNGTSFRYGYESAGVKYVVDTSPYSGTTATLGVNGTAITSVSVVSTAGYDSVGQIRFPSGHFFNYTSKDATKFYGPAVGGIYVVIGDAVSQSSYSLTWPAGTKRWVISHLPDTSAVFCTIIDPKAVWLYCGNLVSKITSYGSGIKYIHIHRLDNITVDGQPSMYLAGSYYCSNSITTFYTRGYEGRTGLDETLTLGTSLVTLTYRIFWNTKFTGNLIIPNSVTTIEGSFFWSTVSMGTLTIGTGVTTLGETAFYQSSFTDIYNNSPKMTVYDHVLYDSSVVGRMDANISATGYSGTLTLHNACTKVLNYCFYMNVLRTGALTIPNTVTTIGSNSFNSCLGLSGTLTFQPTSVLTTINTHAFYVCPFTGTVTFPASLTSIVDARAFQGSQFTSLVFESNGNLSIGDLTFYNTTTITSVVFTSVVNLTIGGTSIFSFTQASLSFPSTLTTITGGANLGVYRWNSITSGSVNYPAEDNVLYDISTVGQVILLSGAPKYVGTLTLRNDITSIVTKAFFQCLRTGSLILPSTLVSIGDSAFYQTGFTGNLTIPNSVTTIGNTAFWTCTSMTGVLAIGTGLTTLGTYVFDSNRFGSITGGSTNYPVEDNVLYDITTVGQIKAYANAYNYIGTLTLKTGTTIINASCFSSSKRTGTLTILSTVTTIGTSAFQNSTTFTRCDSYPTTAPTVGASGLALGGTARPLHIPVSNSGYNVAPWTTTSIFSTITNDL